MLRIAIALSASVLVSACMDTPDTMDAPMSRTASGLPSPFVMVGEAGPGAIAAGELRGDGIAVKTEFSGRAAGIVAFCSGNADAVLMTSGFTSAEWQICKDLNGSWSAFGTQKGATIYVRHELAGALLKKAKTTFLS